MAQAKAEKWQILGFIQNREVITSYDLMERFGYTYSYACKKLSIWKGQGLVRNLGSTPTTYRGQWYLTDKGHARLYYLSRKLGVLTEREEKEWSEWLAEEMRKPLEERRIWWGDGTSVRGIKHGERGVTLGDAKEALELNRSMARYG